jgi:hypothetical protein
MTFDTESKSRRISRLVVTALTILTIVNLGAVQFEQIVVDDPRPMEKIAEAIAQRCRCIITYEDPRYTSKQLVDLTSKRKDGKREPRVLGLPQVIFAFNYDTGASNQANEVARNVEFAIGQFNGSRKDGVSFRLERTREMLHVIPSEGSILTTPVRGVLKQGTAFDVIRSIVNAVGSAQNVKIDTFGMEQMLRGIRVSLQTDSGNADQMLMSVWPQISNKTMVSWKLLYSGGRQFYVFNVVPLLELPVAR